MMPRRITTLACLLLTACVPAWADEKLPAHAKVASLSVSPTSVKLASPYSYAQLVITAKLDTGEVVDVTRLAKVSVPEFAKISPAGQVRPVQDGSGSIQVTLDGETLDVPVTVSDAAGNPPVSFVQDVQPALARMGCNQGTCHGGAQGKNGFKLSLRGYDSLFDHRSLTDDLDGRRFNRAAPDKSLMLLKPSGSVPHVGGVTMAPGDRYYRLIRAWIAAGLPLDLNAPRVTSITLTPGDRTLPMPGMKQQFSILATYSDGKTRDVTAEGFLESSNTEVLTVDNTGLATTVRRGETTILARYDGSYAATTVIVMGDRSGFEWKQLPVQNRVDELVDEKLKKLKITPGEICDDATFLRRVYLDLTGLPPTSDQVRAFLADTRPQRLKRDVVIDALVGSPAYVDHWTNRWADLLQVNRKFLGETGAKRLRDWIHQAVANNMPYDEFARAILNGSGSTAENPPAGYYQVLRTPDLVMENTTQLFLAVRFNCNKCHDHPFEKWTQDHYMGLSAFFAQVGRDEDPNFKDQKLNGTAVEKPLPLVEVITDQPKGDFIHERTGAVTEPLFPFTHAGEPETAATRREKLATWVTSQHNPYFAKSYANRIWSYLTGVGVIEPVDDIRAGNPPSNPALLKHLTNKFVASKFDVNAMVKQICKSRTYQLSIETNASNKDDTENYSHAIARRLPAEALFDSIHQATGSVTRLPGLPVGARAAQLVDSSEDLPGGFLGQFGRPVRESACECERSNTMMLGPVLAMVNGPVVADAVSDQNGRLMQFVAKTSDDRIAVEEIYLSVLNRKPTDAEIAAGIQAIQGGGEDHARIQATFAANQKAFDDYDASVPKRQAEWESVAQAERPTRWEPLPVSAFNARSGAKGTVSPDGTVLVMGPSSQIEVYELKAEAVASGVTGLRLEVLTDDALPQKGPGRSENGNFVLNALFANVREFGKPGSKPINVLFSKAEADFSQAGFEVYKALDGDFATGWAIAPQAGKPHTAVFTVKGEPAVGPSVWSIRMEQRYGTNHAIGKFRLSITRDPKPSLKSSASPQLVAIIDIPADQRTPEQAATLREAYLKQDAEYARLKAQIQTPPPADPRVVGAQDLVWALLNSPAFLFNH